MLSLVAYQSSEESESEAEESTSSKTVPSKQDEKDSSKLGSSSSSLSFAVPPKAKESVKISVPSLKDFEDDEKDEPSTKKIKKSNDSGLISMLPPPKYSKQAASQKSFMPYVLTKKQTPSVSPTAKSVVPNSNSVESSNKPTLFSKPLVKTENHSETKLPVIEKDDSSPVTDFFSLQEPQHKSVGYFSMPSSKNILQSQEESSQMPAGIHKTNNLSDKLSLSSQGSSSPSCGSQSENNAHVQCSESVPHSVDYAADPSWGNQTSSSSYAGYPELDPSVKEYTAGEGFLRLQGKRKGQEEINIIDVSVDDQLSDKSKWLTKSLTEETVHRPSRKKNDMPTQLQKRKHQITYLAFQAKERELELKNQWSQNRLTKRETQAKYGF